MIGDIVFFKRELGFFNRMVAKMTKSNYTHVGLIVDYNEKSKVATIVESNVFVNTRITLIGLNECHHAVYTVKDKTEEQVENILKHAYRKIGTKYDYMQILGLFISLLFKRKEDRWFNSKNKMICSELIDIIYIKSGIKRKNSINIGNVTPVELLEVYDFVERKEV